MFYKKKLNELRSAVENLLGNKTALKKKTATKKKKMHQKLRLHLENENSS
jgi:hypothetical protein